MASEVRVEKVSSLIKNNILVINDGFRAKNSELSKTTGVPFARAGNINGGFDFKGADLVPQENQAKVGIKISKPGDVVFTSKGTVGRFAYVSDSIEKFIYSPQLCFWRTLDETVLSSRYLYYWMHSHEFLSQVHALKGQTDMADYVSLRDQREMEVTLPDINTQNKIAYILGSLDDKIELNKKINQTLEQMAQALFKSWFVDFDPVFDNLLDKHDNNLEKAKAYLENKGAEDLCLKLAKRYEQRQQIKDQKPLPQNIRNLFPSDFHHDQDLGWIPGGWEASSLGEHFNIVMGQSPKGDTYNEDGDGMVFFQGRRDFGFRYPTPRVYTTDPKRIASKGDTLISVRAPVGDRNLAATECCLGRGVASLKHKSGSTSFTYYLVGIIESKLADRGADGTVFSSINKKELAGFPFIAPNEETISSFDSLVRSFDNKIEVNSSQVNELENIRNTLLPKLINGTIKLGD